MADPMPWVASEPVAQELGGRDGMRGSCFSGDFVALAEGDLGGQSSGKEGDTQKITKIRYLLVDGDVLSSLQWLEDVAAARRSLPLAELLEVHTKATEALDVTAGTRRSRRGTKRDSLRGARLWRTARLFLAATSRGSRTLSLGSRMSHLIGNRHLIRGAASS